MNGITFENVGKESIESNLFLRTESVLSYLRYSSPFNLLIELLLSINV